MTDNPSAFQQLALLAGRTRQTAHGLPAQTDARPQWSGVGFSLLGQHFVAPMGEITELLEVPAYTRLPGVESWVRGVANVRGRLLPVFDLAAFFNGKISSPRKQRRVLVLEVDDLYSGLLVDQVFGMQHFFLDNFSSEMPSDDGEVNPFLDGHYQQSGQQWSLFSPAKLARDPRFANAAAG